MRDDLCVCGHHPSVHEMDMNTHRLVGPCHGGEWIDRVWHADSCECVRFEKEDA